MGLQQQIDLRSIKVAARNEFGQTPGIVGFGIGDGTIRIYVQDSRVREHLPGQYQGAPIEIILTGDVVAYPRGSTESFLSK